MSTLQVRGISDDVRQTLKARAAAAGQSLSEYVLGELTKIAAQPTLGELTERIRVRGTTDPATRADVVLDAERAARA